MKPKPNSDELEDFAHNYIYIRMKCPECVITTKGKNHVRVKENLSGFWWHFKTEHGKISNSQFNTDEIRAILKVISKALNLGFSDFEIAKISKALNSKLSSSEITKISKAIHLGMIGFD